MTFFPTNIIPIKCVRLIWRFQKLRGYMLYFIYFSICIFSGFSAHLYIYLPAELEPRAIGSRAQVANH